MPATTESDSGPSQARFCSSGPDSIGSSFGRPIDRNAMWVATPLPIIAEKCFCSHQRGSVGALRAKRHISTALMRPISEKAVKISAIWLVTNRPI